MGRHQEAKSCCEAWKKSRQGQVTLEGTQAQGTKQNVCFQSQVPGAGEGMDTKSHHFGAWVALLPKPESGLALRVWVELRSKGSCRVKGQAPLIYCCSPIIWHNAWLMFVE